MASKGTSQLVKSMMHLNGHMMCAIDVETTGLDPTWHEIIEIACIPVDTNLEAAKTVMPFSIYMKPEHPERVDNKAKKVVGKKIQHAMKHGFDKFYAADMFIEWFENLDIPLDKKLTPLAHNWAFDKAFIQEWLGTLNMHHYIDYHCRDTMIIANFINDRHVQRCERPPFPKMHLSYLASQLDMRFEGAHTAFNDALMTIKIYKRMINEGVFA